jgi:hypothetical protein
MVIFTKRKWKLRVSEQIEIWTTNVRLFLEGHMCELAENDWSLITKVIVDVALKSWASCIGCQRATTFRKDEQTMSIHWLTETTNLLSFNLVPWVQKYVTIRNLKLRLSFIHYPEILREMQYSNTAS